ncbi:transposase domain-containing protein [Shewanella vesiculosa]|uniref:transposase domain-containing protein n=1 Tax=Shewanella vesiculosa TaxID=518738 RepID=UPI00384F7385
MHQVIEGHEAIGLSGFDNGVKYGTGMYSIVETAKANGLTPYDYITHLLEQFSQPGRDIEQLLPWNVNLDGL